MAEAQPDLINILRALVQQQSGGPGAAPFGQAWGAPKMQAPLPVPPGRQGDNGLNMHNMMQLAQLAMMAKGMGRGAGMGMPTNVMATPWAGAGGIPTQFPT